MKSECKSIIKGIKLNRERGSSSVLVIMIMLLLITFGVLAMMSSYSNLKIARKQAQWTKDFYQLESIAEEGITNFNINFKASQLEIQNMNMDERLNPEFVSQLPVGVQDELIADPNTGVKNLDAWKSLEDGLFLFVLYQKAVQENAYFEKATFDEAIFDADPMSWTSQRMTFLYFDDNTNRKMLVSINIDLNATSVADASYEVVEWREVPADFIYEAPLEFGDPKGE